MTKTERGLVVGAAVAPFVLIGLLWVFTRPAEKPAPPSGPWDPQPAPPTSTAPTDEAIVQARCASCHPLVKPEALSKGDWGRAMNYLHWLLPAKAGLTIPEEEWTRIARYHIARAPEQLPELPPEPASSPVRFERQAIGALPGAVPRIANVKIVDLFGEGRPGVLACDADAGTVIYLRRRENGSWEETELARTGPPAHAEVVDVNGDGKLDIIVAVLGNAAPTDDRCGKVVLLTNDGTNHFRSRTLLEGVGRVADVRPADFNRDGAVDFVVAVFGHVKEGKVGWLEHRPNDEYVFHTLIEKPGAVHVPVADLNGDGAPDFVALMAQDSEEIVAWINDGKGDFEAKSIFKAGTPVHGSSGIILTDLDGDGDLDIVATNGDALDLPEPDRLTRLRPYHGVQWLENRGGLTFVPHEIMRYYGSYSVAAGDIAGKGRQDLVLTSLYNNWEDPERSSILWLENDGRQHFTPHLVDRAPTELATVAVGDLDGDGRADIVAGVFHLLYPLARKGRVALWKNGGPAK